MSVIDPPEFVTAGDPKKPEKNLKMIMDAALLARAQPIWKRTKRPRTSLKTLLRPLYRFIVNSNRLAVIRRRQPTRLQKKEQI